MLKFCQNMAVANAVLAVVNCAEEMPEFYVEAYSNGREQGYHIKGWVDGQHVGMSFSEYRNTDSIVVYLGGSTDFSMHGNSPDEKAWKAARHFKPGRYDLAAEYILGVMRSLYTAKTPAGK